MAMVYAKEILTGVSALACALGIGFVMQNSATAELRYGDAEQQIDSTGAQGSETPGADANMAVASGALLDVQQITLTSAEFDNNIALPEPDSNVVTASAPASVLDTPSKSGPLLGPKEACNISVSARPVAAAMVNLSMDAPCFPDERLTVHHSGMIFTETTSATGTINLTMPALTEDAAFVIVFANGEGAVAQARVEEVADYHRSVLQWKGHTGFQIHALEFGSTYGEPGHLWADAPGTIAGAVIGDTGVLTRHGDDRAPDPLLAEVYTFPKAANARAGTIVLSVETEVTDANCGVEIEAQALELQEDRSIRTRNLTLDVPDCSAGNSFLVLNNLLEDLKVAAK